MIIFFSNPSNDQHSDGSVVTDDTIPSVEDVDPNDVDDQISSSPTAGGPVPDKIIGAAPVVKARSKPTEPSAEGPQKSNLTHDIVSTAEYNPWAGIIDAIPKLRRIKTLDSNMEYGEDCIQVYDWVSDFQNDFPFLLHLMTLAFIPSMPRLTNLALGNASDFKYNNKKITGAYMYLQSFFMIGSVTFSSLFKGEFNRAIAIKPLASFWPPSRLFEMVSCSQRIPSLKTRLDPLRPVKRASIAKHSGQASVRPWNDNVPLFDAQSELDPTQIHKCPPIKSELNEGTIAFLMFTATKYGEDVGSFNIQIVGKIYDPPAVKSSTIPAKPLPKYLTELGDIGVLGDEFPETPSDDDGDTQIKFVVSYQRLA
ncbi:hypothetical protein IW262DRAFT_1454872 [Armillaria fumosa]|nr:hypothetical protein IW262DRAFT_1454872 [Armillaria fumosa]